MENYFWQAAAPQVFDGQTELPEVTFSSGITALAAILQDEKTGLIMDENLFITQLPFHQKDGVVITPERLSDSGAPGILLMDLRLTGYGEPADFLSGVLHRTADNWNRRKVWHKLFCGEQELLTLCTILLLEEFALKRYAGVSGWGSCVSGRVTLALAGSAAKSLAISS